MAYTLTIPLALGAGNTGLTLEAQLLNGAGTHVGGAVTTGFTELGASGNYLWTGSIPSGHSGAVMFSVSPGGAVKGVAGITPADELAAMIDAGVFTDEALANAPGSTVTADNIRDTVWGNGNGQRRLTATAAETEETLAGQDIRITKGSLWEWSVTGLGPITDRVALYFTLKDSRAKSDASALVQISEGDGLLVLHRGPITGASQAQGAITVDDADAGNLTVRLYSAATLLLPTLESKGAAWYDLKVIREADVDASQLQTGGAIIASSITQATA